MGCTLPCPRGGKIHSAKTVNRVQPALPVVLLKSKSEEVEDHGELPDPRITLFKSGALGKSMVLKVEKESSIKVRPPFPKLPAFSVDAIVLSLVGYEDEVIALLRLLSHNTRAYERSHKGFYGPFLMKYSKEFTGTLSFRAEIKGVRLENETVSTRNFKPLYMRWIEVSVVSQSVWYRITSRKIDGQVTCNFKKCRENGILDSNRSTIRQVIRT